MRDIVKFKNFLNEEDCNSLNDWTDFAAENGILGKSLNPKFVSEWNYDKRLTSRNYGSTTVYPEIVYKIYNNITEFLNLQHLPRGVAGGGRDGVVVSLTYPGGDLYEHMDPKEPNGEVLRCNILTRKPTSGGILYINDHKVNLEVGELHCYLPSMLPHRFTEVSGDISRVMWMFSYQISLEQFEDFVRVNKEASRPLY